VAEELAETGLYLPSGLAITEEQIREVCAAVHAVMD
jgi:dTDP-4-amino-4,6-dideoxygalactose transaminase